jgi:hypothetical protein
MFSHQSSCKRGKLLVAFRGAAGTFIFNLSRHGVNRVRVLFFNKSACENQVRCSPSAILIIGDFAARHDEPFSTESGNRIMHQMPPPHRPLQRDRGHETPRVE